VVHTSPPRQWMDLSFLKLEPLESQNQRKYIMHEAQISFSICGSDDQRWAAYCFVDTHFDDSEFGDETLPHKGIQDDPIARGKMDANCPIKNPREYFLAIFEIRIAQVSEEWKCLVRMAERAIIRSVSRLVPFSFI
jgi:hypothetical protein